LINKNFLRRLELVLIIMCGLLIFIPNRAIAATNIIQMEHKTNVPVDKVWQIKFNQPINEDKLSTKVLVYDAFGSKVPIKISYDSINKAIIVEPTTRYNYGQTYSLHIYETIRSVNSVELKTHISMNFTTESLNQRPKISIIDIDHSPLVQGDNARFYIASQESKKVQYRVYLKNQQLNKYQELTNGYSAVMEALSPFCIDRIEAFSVGAYELKVYVKRADANGIKIDDNTDYDDLKTYEFQCLPKNDSNSSYRVKDIITDATRYKVGQSINIEQNIKQDASVITTLKAYKLYSEKEPEELTSKTTWVPNEVGMYKLETIAKALNENAGDYSKSTVTKYIQVCNKEYIYQQYNRTLDEIVDMEYKLKGDSTQLNYLSSQYNSKALKTDIKEYLDSKKIEEDDNAIYQFLTLNYIYGITAEDLNGLLGGKLAGQGKIFLDACEKYNVNPAYIVAHAILETGNGKSLLANGIEVEGKMTYNMFGIGALEGSADKTGSERAYKESWFTVEAAIEGGIKYISSGYINNIMRKQNTLYEIRWNPASPATYQYASDIGWAYKQIKRMKEILDKCKNAYLVFEIPQYK
jgi:beta-N-acetylglucosaminidase